MLRLPWESRSQLSRTMRRACWHFCHQRGNLQSTRRRNSSTKSHRDLTLILTSAPRWRSATSWAERWISMPSGQKLLRLKIGAQGIDGTLLRKPSMSKRNMFPSLKVTMRTWFRRGQRRLPQMKPCTWAPRRNLVWSKHQEGRRRHSVHWSLRGNLWLCRSKSKWTWI